MINTFQLPQSHHLHAFNKNLNSLPSNHIHTLNTSLIRLKSFYLLLLDNGLDSVNKSSFDAVNHYLLSIGLPGVDQHSIYSINAQLELLDEVYTLVDNWIHFGGGGSGSSDSSNSAGGIPPISSTDSTDSIYSNINNTQQQPPQQPPQQPQQQPPQPPQPPPRNDSYIVINLSTLTPLVLPLLFLLFKCGLMLYIFCRHGSWPRKIIMAVLTIGYSIWEATRFVHVRRHIINPPNQGVQGRQQNGQANALNNPNNAYDALNQAAQQARANGNGNDNDNTAQTPHPHPTNPLNPLSALDQALDRVAHLNLHYEAQRLRIPGPVPTNTPLPPYPATRMAASQQRPPRHPMWWTRLIVPALLAILTLFPEVERRRSRALKWRYSAFKSIKAAERLRRERRHEEREERERGEQRGEQNEQNDQRETMSHTYQQTHHSHDCHARPSQAPSAETPDIDEQDEQVAEQAQVENWEE
ncbi:hypothetical protein E3P92_00186 [Wallemia ichthyophaga]|uniref:Uncharacterized protein n=1 Tax=Wallemia ichthyophaga TaxID=245174 RepID=A0A4V4M2X1_WALIC|nr:hypothetical protein E3P90_00474 [Wallemia ichthyophaga]TIB18000.1 hypothetical protein E3P93_00331 [Wallemia ichthyophaga]TIB18960.1 hypothetical protein E3P92_00186 [Wallemia ichthyophaga]TIB25694.1 hypothetical protein E3P89_00315 [Wallemia ichthyophaga]TIB27174.1 hypothetical protein E3P88_00343 [Wallemia ichthyophaga]